MRVIILNTMFLRNAVKSVPFVGITFRRFPIKIQQPFHWHLILDGVDIHSTEYFELIFVIKKYEENHENSHNYNEFTDKDYLNVYMLFGSAVSWLQERTWPALLLVCA